MEKSFQKKSSACVSGEATLTFSLQNLKVITKGAILISTASIVPLVFEKPLCNC